MKPTERHCFNCLYCAEQTVTFRDPRPKLPIVREDRAVCLLSRWPKGSAKLTNVTYFHKTRYRRKAEECKDFKLDPLS